MKSATHDYVDTPYWSVMQVKVKRLLLNTLPANSLKTIEEEGDLGKVTYSNQTY